MAATDWYSKTIGVVKSILGMIWQGITWPVRLASGLPDWVKGIIFGILILLAAYLAYRLWKSWNRQEWRFIKS